MTRDRIISRLRELRPWLAERGVSRVRLFGSAARGDAGPDSDIDLLVDLSRPMGMEFFGLEADLTDALGAKVDLHTKDSLHRIVLQRALDEAVDS
jgi:predicted nucleotidyltransferase